MSKKQYRVEVFPHGEYWYDLSTGYAHCEHGPAIRYFDSRSDRYILKGVELTEGEWEYATRLVKEMTVAQIEEKLGYKIKVIADGDN